MLPLNPIQLISLNAVLVDCKHPLTRTGVYYDLPVKLLTPTDPPGALPICLVYSPRTGYFQERPDLYYEALSEHRIEEIDPGEFKALLAAYHSRFVPPDPPHALSPSRLPRLSRPLVPRAFRLGRDPGMQTLFGVLDRARRNLAEARRVAQGRAAGAPRSVLAPHPALDEPARQPTDPRAQVLPLPPDASSPPREGIPQPRQVPAAQPLPSGLTPRFAGALEYAARLHLGQSRKGIFPVPVLGHLLAVTALTLEHGGGEDQAIAALLHDALEDVSGDLAPEIEARFGAAVLGMVRACTDATAEDKRGEAALEGQARLAAWHARKAAHLAHLPSAPSETFLVSLADKTHNSAALLEEWAVEGEALWARFTTGRAGSLAYHRTLLGIFAAVAPHQPPGFARLLERYQGQVEALERT